MFGSRRRGQAAFDIWPGFVDVLATILLVFVFVLLFFVVAQFYTSNVLTDRDRALSNLEQDIAELSQILSMERDRRAGLEDSLAELESRLATSMSRADSLEAEVATTEAERARLAASLTTETARLAAVSEQLGDRTTALEQARSRLAGAEEELAAERVLSAEATAQVEALSADIRALREQLTSISAALALAESTVEAQRAEIAELGNRLNVAMAQRVQELERYRSDFFGRLREVLEGVQEIEIDGDRFRFQSELFFASGSAEVGAGGRAALNQLAEIIEEISQRIPDDVAWVLQVEGHTDSRPIATARFPSNWELSAARATNIVHYLIDNGVPAHRLAAAGFGEHQPVDSGETPEALARNRRIELRLTNP